MRNDLCACTDRPLHMHCQRQLLASSSKDGKCTVCKTEFRNAEFVVERRTNYKWVSLQLLLGAAYAGYVMCGVLFFLHASNALNVEPEFVCHVSPSSSNKRGADAPLLHVNTCHTLHSILMVGNIGVLLAIFFTFCGCNIAATEVKKAIRQNPRIVESRRWKLDWSNPERHPSLL